MSITSLSEQVISPSQRCNASPVEKEALIRAIEQGSTDSANWYQLGSLMEDNESIQVRGESRSNKCCFIHAIEHDYQNHQAWYALGILLKHDEKRTIHGHSYDKMGCFAQALSHSYEISPSLDYSKAWYFVGTKLSPTASAIIAARPINKQQCFIKTLEHNQKHGKAWNNLGVTMKPGDVVKINDRDFSLKKCFMQAVRCEPELRVAWNNLGIALQEGETADIAGNAYTSLDCLIKGSKSNIHASWLETIAGESTSKHEWVTAAGALSLLPDQVLKQTQLGSYANHLTLQERLLMAKSMTLLPPSLHQTAWRMMQERPTVFENKHTVLKSLIDQGLCSKEKIKEHLLQASDSKELSQVSTAHYFLEWLLTDESLDFFGIEPMSPEHIAIFSHYSSINSSNTEKHPVRIYEELKKNEKKPRFESILNKNRLLQNLSANSSPATFLSIRELEILFQGKIPTKEDFRKLFCEVSRKQKTLEKHLIDALENKKKKELQATKESLEEIEKKGGAFSKDLYLTRLWNELHETPKKLSPDAVRFFTIMFHLFSQEHPEQETLTAREQTLAQVLESIQNCPAGKEDGIAQFYRSITAKKPRFAKYERGDKERPSLHALVQETFFTEVLKSREFIASIANCSPTRLPEYLHQAKFIMHLLSPRLGIYGDFNLYDPNSGVLLNQLTALISDDAGQHKAATLASSLFTPKMVQVALEKRLRPLLAEYKKALNDDANNGEVEQLQAELYQLGYRGSESSAERILQDAGYFQQSPRGNLA